MTDSTDTLAARLREQHFCRVPFAATQSELQAAANRFLAFLALPEGDKRQLHFPARLQRASADGYTDKSTVDRKDPKQFFHFSPWLMRQPISHHLAATNATVDAFFDAATALYTKIEASLFSLFDTHLPVYRDQVFNGEQLVDGILRFLCYAPRPEHSFGARAHFDKGFSTLAVADSAPGLRIGCCNQHPLTPVRYREGEALFMPAWMLFQASEGEIKPAWHDVVHAPGEPDVNAICARWSIVFFVNNPDRSFSSWDELHTPLH